MHVPHSANRAVLRDYLHWASTGHFFFISPGAYQVG
jgi:hypothetical protein